MEREISIREIKGLCIGQMEDADAGTGCTVLVCERGMAAGLDIRGGGPASRDTHLLDPLTAAQSIHAVVLGGGSAFGLGAADGVMAYLEKRDIFVSSGSAC
jgi:L-aminopeptidase/D-esterase-like protein